MTARYGEMTALFIRVLNLQRMLYEDETGYIDALEHAWTSSIALSGFLLEGGLTASASTEMDLPAGGIGSMQPMDGAPECLKSPPLCRAHRVLNISRLKLA